MSQSRANHEPIGLVLRHILPEAVTPCMLTQAGSVERVGPSAVRNRALAPRPEVGWLGRQTQTLESPSMTLNLD